MTEIESENSHPKAEFSEFVKKYFWMIRPCEDYNKEASECKAFKSRFNQYFIHGSATDCTPWLQNASNCFECTENFNDTACRQVIKNESARRLKRLEDHAKNDVWEKRTQPPDNWNPPLPEWFKKDNKNSFFYIRKDEFIKFMEETDPYKSNCTIL